MKVTLFIGSNLLWYYFYFEFFFFFTYISTAQNIVFSALKPIPLSPTIGCITELYMNFTTGPQLLIM